MSDEILLWPGLASHYPRTSSHHHPLQYQDGLSPFSESTRYSVLIILSANEPRENQSSGFPTRSDTNRSVQSQRQARDLKFWLKVEEELYYLSSENKGTDADASQSLRS